MDIELREYLAERFGRMEERLVQLDARLGQVETRFDQMETRLGQMETRLGQMEIRLAQVETRLGQVEERLDQVDERLGRVEADLQAVRSEASRTAALVESVQDQVRLVAEGHSILYGAIDRQYEEVRAEMRDVRALLKVWNDLVTRRLGDLERQVREKVGL